MSKQELINLEETGENAVASPEERDRARLHAGETLLQNTLEQIKLALRSDALFKYLLKDEKEIARIKAQLLENIDQNGSDQREKIIAEVVDKLKKQPLDRIFAE